MWLYKDVEFTEDMIGNSIGFVYQIHNTITGRRYYGKKNFFAPKYKMIKGKKKKLKGPSDWKTYWSSSDALKADVASLGEEFFKREIVHLCPSKGILNYLEMREQIINDVLLKPDEFYNAFVGGKIHRNHVKGLII